MSPRVEVPVAREPFRFVSEGRIYICCYHPGHDPRHPANQGASHGCCAQCLPALLAEAQASVQGQA